METPDNYLISIDARTGRNAGMSRSPIDEEYFSTTAPVIVATHVLVGTGNDADAPGFLQSFDPKPASDNGSAIHGADEPRRSEASKPGKISTPHRGGGNP
jgi:hypothetical protein